MPNGYNSHTANPPYVSSHGDGYLFRASGSHIPVSSVPPHQPFGSVYTSSQEDPLQGLLPSNRVYYKSVELDVSIVRGSRDKISPIFVMRCIQN